MAQKRTQDVLRPTERKGPNQRRPPKAKTRPLRKQDQEPRTLGRLAREGPVSLGMQRARAGGGEARGAPWRHNFSVKKNPEMPPHSSSCFPRARARRGRMRNAKSTTPSQMRSNDDEECNQSACPTTKSRPIIAVVLFTFDGSKRIFST